MYIKQAQLENLGKALIPNKAVIIYGPRRCGKTTLLKKFLETAQEKYILASGEDITIQDYLASCSVEKLKSFIGENRLLVIDEAQKIPRIGLNIKLLLDHREGLKVIATGSSSFDLAKDTGEPLTGRKFTLRLFPLAQLELCAIESRAETAAHLEERLIYGSYPEVVIADDNSFRQQYLRELTGSYLYKDILELDGLRHNDKLIRLLQLLAFQLGGQVSLHELGAQVGMSKNTVERYLELLEKAFVIFKVRGFSRNLRKEITKSCRYYFYDTGVRNAVISNFNPLRLRNDTGMLWENYCVAERVKKQEYRQILSNNYFWRTYDRKEIDWVEERGGALHGYEIKWSAAKKTKPPKDWLVAYPGSQYECISPENYLEFIA
jgi:predicted AAA+ superfamily ATPase